MHSSFSLPEYQFPLLGGTQAIFFPRSDIRDVPTIVAGDGIYLVDDAGRRLLDVCSGPFLANLGQGYQGYIVELPTMRPNIPSDTAR